MKNFKHTNCTKSSLEWKKVLHTWQTQNDSSMELPRNSPSGSFTYKNVLDVPYFLLSKKNITEFDALLFSKYVYESQLNASKRGSSVCVHCCCPLHCFLLSHPFIHCLFSMSPWFPRTDWRRWWGAICFSWRMLLTQRHSGDNQPPTHTHTHICPPNTACCTVNSQPTLSHYTWKLTIMPYMAFPASQYLLPFFPLVARGSDFFLSQSPPPVPLNHCFLVNYPVMLLCIESAVRCCADPPTRDHAG